VAKKSDIPRDYVKKSTMLPVAVISLGVGFLSGVVFSAFKTGSSVPVAPQTQPQQAVQEQSVSEEQAKQMITLEREVASDPDNGDAWTQLGNLYFDTKNFERAIRAYKKSLALNPNNANVQTDLGVMYRRTGQPQEAIKAFNKAIEIDVTHEISRFNKGIVLLHDLNDPTGALEAWEDLVKINPAAMTPSGQPISELINHFKESMKK
jgi:cytochrome c-type biogenesis protein CcmH/NrfG